LLKSTAKGTTETWPWDESVVVRFHSRKNRVTQFS
jgi:hypothetical protein